MNAVSIPGSEELEVFSPSCIEIVQRPGEWLMNYFSVIRPPAGQITQPQSCAFLHGVDWKRSTLDRRSLSAAGGWPTQTVPLPGPL
ncbi:hypothetical protein AVEN_130150-1 [Araneus ventricosus]|uniref:Uncharacterized protein n=1 Tax=Araneus ventricosus TaxID=182803 RepID=A0A4Y1ZZ09_ARAVE|nr:hypothetical protein AVEN_130150-1 [Araneus ventricosus]